MKRILINLRISIMRFIPSIFVGLAAAAVLTSCGASGDNQGTEYAPNMYHSVAYEPYTQIKDKNAGRWVTSIDYPDGHAEFYNSNNFNPHQMNMREPAANTVRRTKDGSLPYRIEKDNLAEADKLVNPLETTPALLEEGKILYDRYCEQCHGAKGKGDGLVSAGGIKVTVNGEEKERAIYAGTANLTGDAYKNLSEGHIFHVITHGKGLMWAHGSQISPEDRWKIASYVKTLQK
jgi:mono/diheme cytochrome c family protein